MTKQEKDNRVPLWERMNLTLEEAAAYTGIGTTGGAGAGNDHAGLVGAS